jgi:predicted MFS family arabinose efflux permease
MSSAALDSGRERRMVWVLAGIQFVHILDFVLIMPLGPQLMRLFALSAADFGLLVSVYMFVAGASGVAASAFMDRFDRRKVVCSLLAGFVLAVAATAAAQSYAMLVVAHALAGGFGGVLGMQLHAFVGDTIPDNRRGSVTGILMSAFAVASVAGVPVGLVLAEYGSWRAPFAVLALVSAALLVVALRLLPPVTGHLQEVSPERTLARLGRVLAHANHRRAFLLVALVMFAGFAVIPYLAPYMVQNVGLKESQLAVLYFFGGAATLFTARWIGRLVDLHGKQRVFRVVAIASSVPILISTHLPPVPLTVAIVVSVLFMTIVSGRFVPLMALVNAAAEPGQRGSFLSLSGAVQQACAGLGSLTAGMIMGHGAAGELTRYGWVGWLAAALTLVAVLWAPRVRSLS